MTFTFLYQRFRIFMDNSYPHYHKHSKKNVKMKGWNKSDCFCLQFNASVCLNVFEWKGFQHCGKPFSAWSCTFPGLALPVFCSVCGTLFGLWSIPCLPTCTSSGNQAAFSPAAAFIETPIKPLNTHPALTTFLIVFLLSSLQFQLHQPLCWI